jgi:hypothetical protein
MDVKQAVELAKTHVADLFAKEGVRNLGLEEAEYDDGSSQWKITVGFSRPWDEPNAFVLAPLRRTYKVVTIDAEGKVLSVKNREAAYAD